MSATTNDGSEQWTVTGPGTDKARVLVSSGGISDISATPPLLLSEFRAEYFSWMGKPEPAFTGEPVATLCVASINYDWGEMAPPMGASALTTF